jgi:hypothetical protein
VKVKNGRKSKEGRKEAPSGVIDEAPANEIEKIPRKRKSKDGHTYDREIPARNDAGLGERVEYDGENGKLPSQARSISVEQKSHLRDSLGAIARRGNALKKQKKGTKKTVIEKDEVDAIGVQENDPSWDEKKKVQEVVQSPPESMESLRPTRMSEPAVREPGDSDEGTCSYASKKLQDGVVREDTSVPANENDLALRLGNTSRGTPIPASKHGDLPSPALGHFDQDSVVLNNSPLFMGEKLQSVNKPNLGEAFKLRHHSEGKEGLVWMKYQPKPPSISTLYQSLESYGLLKIVHQEPYFGDVKDEGSGPVSVDIPFQVMRALQRGACVFCGKGGGVQHHCVTLFLSMLLYCHNVRHPSLSLSPSLLKCF